MVRLIKLTPSEVIYRITVGMRISVDLPLHDSGVVSTEGEEVRVPRSEPHLGHVAAMALKRSELRAFNHGRVAIQLDVTVIIRSRHDLLPVGQRTVGPIGMVDVGAVLTRLPHALHSPTKSVRLGRPNFVSEVRRSASVLSAIRDCVVQDLVTAIIGANGR